MAIVPRIDTPCPLGAAEQRAIDGHCSRCDRDVHRLDALDADARRALFAAAAGPLCVSYRVPRRAGLGATIAVSLVVATASAGVFAADPPAAAPAASAEATPSTGTRIRHEAPRDLDGVLVIGAVNDPQDAAAPEDTSVPELPVQPSTGSRIRHEAPRDLDGVLVIGAVNDPQDAALPEDTSVPVLPAIDDAVLIVGGVTDPAAVAWIDTDDTVADLPMTTDDGDR